MIRLRRFVLVLTLGLGRLAAAESVDLLLVASNDDALRPVLAKISHPLSITRGAWTCWTGELGSKRIALTRAEGDPLNAVAATTLAIRLHPPRLLVVFGASRAHDASLNAGDIVVSEKFAAFDGFVSSVTPIEGGSRPLTWAPLPHLAMTSGEAETPAMSFAADPAAAAIALKLKIPNGRVLSGVLGSANQINREADRISWLRATWHTSTEDGVSAHVAGCAALLSVPAIGICVVGAPDSAAADFVLRFMEALP